MINNNDTLAVLTTWPQAKSLKSGKDFSAIGWHSRNTLIDIAKQKSLIIFGEIIRDESPNNYKKIKNIRLCRTWQKGNPLSILKTFYNIIKNKDIHTLLIQFEFNVFGGNLSNTAIIIGMLITRSFGKKIIFETHQVVTNFELISPHLGIYAKTIKFIYSTLLRIYYQLIGILANEIFVFEEVLRDELSRYIAIKKIHTLPLPVPYFQIKNSRKRKDEFKVMIFGYLNWYKGIDILMDGFAKHSHSFPKLKLIVAGDKNPYHKGKKYYDKYCEKLESISVNCDRITSIGFVEEQKVKSVFQDCDLVIMPYRTLFASSGPLSLALRYKKPIVMSSPLMGYLRNLDFRSSMFRANLNPEDLFFELEPKKIMQFLGAISQNTKKMQKISKFVELLAHERAPHVYTTKLLKLCSSQNMSNNIAIAKI